MSGHAKTWGCAALAAAAMMVVSSPSNAQSESPAGGAAPGTSPPPAAATSAVPASKQKGAAAWQLLVGNTAVATSRTGNYTEFFAADGVVKHLDRDGKATGKWTLEGQKVCFDFPEEDDRSCVDVEVEGTKGAFVDEDASRDTFDILAGNAKNL